MEVGITKSQMRRTLTLLALGALNVLLWSPPVLALDPSLDVSQYAHNVWSFRNGFLNGAVYAIAQTSDGYLWFGTQSGVVRFDGARAVPLTLPPGQQLPSTAVGALLAAGDGTLWIGTLDGLASWKDGRLTQYPALAHQTVIALLQDRDGTVWAGGFGSPTGKLCAIRSGGTTCYGEDGSLGAAVASLYQDTDGSMWVGAATGLWRWSPGPPTRYLAEPISNQQALTQGDLGSGVIVASDNVGQIVGRRVMEYPLRGVPSPLTAAHLLRDRNGGLWIGTNAHGLVHSYEGKSSLLTHSDGLSTDQVITLFQDREGTIWVATPDGLDQFRESPVGSLSVKDGLSNASTTSVLAARDGSIWIGTADGLNRWKDGGVTIYRRRGNPGLPDDAIESLFEDERGRLWVSGFHGLAAFEKGRFTAVPSVPVGFKHAIEGDSHGGLWLSLWLTSNDYGLVHLVDGKIIEHVSWQKLGGGPGTGLVPEHDGGVWTGLLSGGIAYFRAGQIRNLPLSDEGAGAGKVLDLGSDRHGTLWAAAENGLSRIANGRVATLTTANGLPCNAVHWIIADDVSSYWLYTRCGLLRIDQTELDAWIADPKRTIRATTFDTTDGIRPVATIKGFRPAVTKSSDGKIWFANGDTASFIDPSHIGINTLRPPVHIEQITADGKTYDATRGLRLPPHVRNLAIDYTALSLVAPQKVRFRYKLEGQDPDWREVINYREVQYSNLLPGTYRFRVIACNNSGVWNEKGDVLDFSIAPAYYQTNWFRALCVAAFLTLLWAAYQLRVRQIEEQEKKFREAVETMPALAFIAQPDGYRTFVNRRWVEYTGMAVEQATGSGWETAVHPDDLKKIIDLRQRLAAKGEPVEYEMRLRRGADGQFRWFQTRLAPLRDTRGKVVKWCGVALEVEDRKRAEQLQADLAHTNRVSLLGELAASIAHELKQPITGAITSARACLRWLDRPEPDLERARAAVVRIDKDGARASEIIDHMRALYKKTPPKRELVDVNEIIGEMAVLLRGEANRFAVSIRTDLGGDLPRITADHVQLQQVMMNLMLNAIEAMKETGGVLTVKSQRDESGQVLISVNDTGVGLPAEKADQIFNAFFTTKPQGSGMGLAISRSIVESHGGRLWATPNDGRGATFQFTLPIQPETQE
jgi:PAS domain S-box-containing protein